MKIGNKLKLAVTTLVVLALPAGIALTTVPQSSAEPVIQNQGLTIEGDDVTVGEDGLQTFQISVQGAVEWSNAPDPVNTIEVRLGVKHPHEGFEWITSEEYDVDGTQGTQSYSVSGDVLEQTVYNRHDFEPLRGGESTTSTLDVVVRTNVNGGEGDGDNQSWSTLETVEDEVAITVTREENTTVSEMEITIEGSGEVELDG